MDRLSKFWKQASRMAGCVAMNCGGLGATRNNLIFNDVRIFRVGDPATLKMLNSFIVNQ